MLVVVENYGHPVLIGGNIVIIERHGNDFRLLVDGPDRVMRSELVERDLLAAGFVRHGFKWKKDGVVYTTREACEKLNGRGTSANS